MSKVVGYLKYRLRQFLLKNSEKHQLELFLPSTNNNTIRYDIPFDHQLRLFSQNDRYGIVELMLRAGFKGCDANSLERAIFLCVPDGFFVVTDKNSHKIVAMMMARHLSDQRHLFGGRIDWLAVDPDFRGKGLGFIVAAAATNRLIEMNYKNIYVTTDDERIAAIKTFLKIGYVPDLYRQEMFDRWKEVCRILKVEFQPDRWAALHKEVPGLFNISSGDG